MKRDEKYEAKKACFQDPFTVIAAEMHSSSYTDQKFLITNFGFSFHNS